MKQEEAEEARRQEVPVFSLEGLTVHRKRIALYILGTVVALVVAAIVAGALTSASNFEVTLSQSFIQAKAGASASFDVTVQNTAQLSVFAYETHMVGVPAGWSVVRGEDVFGLAPGQSRVLTVELLAAGSTPPNHDYSMELKVIAKTPDAMRELESKVRGVTVKLLGSDLEVTLLARGTTDVFAGGALNTTLSFAACAGPGASAALPYPGDGEPTSAGLTYIMLGGDPNTTGWIEVDVGGDGTFEVNQTLDGNGARIELPPDALAQWDEANPAAGVNASLPLGFRSCTNATGAWNVALTAPLMTYLAPLGPNASYPVDTPNTNEATGTARVSLRVTNNEDRDLTALVRLPDLPAGWQTSLPGDGSAVTLEADGGFRNLEFTIDVAKTTEVGVSEVEVAACLEGNDYDCQGQDVPLDVGESEYFEVKTYTEPSSIKAGYITRWVDFLLVARNLGNQPTEFVARVELNVPEVRHEFWYGDEVLDRDEPFPLEVGESRFLVLRINILPTASQSVIQIHPVFASTTTTSEQRLFMTVNILPYPTPAADGPMVLGDNVTAEYAVATAEGALLFDTNQIVFDSLIDTGERLTHPNYTRPTSERLAPYQFTLKDASKYDGTIHRGFEAFLLGGYREETLVFWLVPGETLYPASNPIRDEIVVIEVKIIGLEKA